jgi:hypothetical protein
LSTSRVECAGVGVAARRNPVDPDRPRVGDELAIARALVDLAQHLSLDVTSEIGATEGKPVHIHL